MTHNTRLAALLLAASAATVQAGEKDELLKLRNTTTNLIKQLVKQGVITDQMAEQMIKQAESDAEKQSAQMKSAAAAKEVVPADEVRVAYVPDFVKDQIREQVRAELRQDVVSDVMAKAKNEQWGLPNALPEWTKRFKLSGDLRLRSQHEYMAKDNLALSYFNWSQINDNQGFGTLDTFDFLNTTEDRQSFRMRFRLGIDALIAEDAHNKVAAGVRLATGNQRDPVSTNQSLGNTGQKYDFTVDRAYLKYDAVDDQGFKWLNLSGGRIKNPWYTGGGEFTGGSEVLWDVDLSFEGVAGTYRYNLTDQDGLASASDQARSVFFTAGAFPLQENLSSDKWLFGGQAGIDWGFQNQDNAKVSVGYFDYVGVQAKQNQLNQQNNACSLNSQANNDSTPQFMQGGNTLAGICRNNYALGSARNFLWDRMGLASDFNIVNINGAYESGLFAPHRLRVSVDYAENLGFNANSILTRYRPNSIFANGGSLVGDNSLKKQTTAWQVRLDYGWPKAEVAGHWNVFAAYKYIGRDAVLDAFTDSDFHLGGTNAKGWFIGANYGLMKNVWLTGRWLSADVITGPPYGVDLLQLDINSQF